jgi:hypothetical protein
VFVEMPSSLSLRGRAIEQTASLPDGREALVRVGVPDDSYIAKRELDTVAVEILVDERVAASVNSVLNVDQETEARALAREIVAGLEAGEFEPTAAAIEPLADRIPG